MMEHELPESTLELIHHSFPGVNLKVFLNEDWGSQADEFRLRLRKAIISKLASPGSTVSKQVIDTLLDLSVPPQLNPQLSDLKISISHSKGLGGWIQAETSSFVGFDIELSSRLSLSPVKRVSTQQELASAPSPAHLWTAKEASFKSLCLTHNLQTLSQVETQTWIPLQNHWWMFKAVCGGETRGNGLSGPYKGFHLGLFKTT